MWIQNVPGGGVNAVAYSPDGRTLYTQDDGRWYTAWDLATHAGRRLLQYSAKHTNHFPRMFVSADGRFLVSNLSPAGRVGSATKEKHAGCRTTTPSPACRWASAGCGSSAWRRLARRAELVLRPKEPGPELRDWPVTGTIKTHNYAPDGKPRRPPELVRRGDRLRRGEPRSRVQTIDMPKRQLQHCRFAPDGDTLVHVHGRRRSRSGTSRRARSRVDKVACDRPYWMLAFHPTQPLIAVRRKDGAGELVEPADRARRCGRWTSTSAARRRCVAFSPDGVTCAVGGSNKRFAVFDVDE